MAAAFVDVLELARELRLLKLGCVSLDGTHLCASASKDKNVTYQRAGELRAQLRLDVDALLAQAEASDREDTDPKALPAEIARREKLLGKMDAACAQLEARAQARAQAEQAEYERKVAARAEREGSSKSPEPKPPSATPEPDEQINLSDPDARLMRKSRREGYTQSYNAQAIVDADGSQLIVGQRVSTCAADVGETEADLAAIPASLGEPSAALADRGYADKATLERLGRERPGLDLYISVHREDAHAERRYDWRPLDKIKAPKTLTDPVLLAMAAKLKTPEGKARYRRRACTVEPVFGIIKSALGFASALRRCPAGCLRQAVSLRSARQFLLRGLKKVTGEWNLVCLAYNLKRLHTLRQTALAS